MPINSNFLPLTQCEPTPDTVPLQVCWLDGMEVHQGEATLEAGDGNLVYVPQLDRKVRLGADVFPLEKKPELTKALMRSWQ